MIRGRFAPTPSGSLHIGNARTALLAWLQVRCLGGTFVLRMEDIDKPRSRPEWARQIVDDLRWLGLDWDEGPDVGGPYGPYEQSLRSRLYEKKLLELDRAGLLYPCYCSRAELMAITSAPHGLDAEGPAYPGTCRRLSPQERRARAAAKAPSLRFAMPEERDIAFLDGAAGPQLVHAPAGGDFVVRRADGIVGYQLAVVVDDIAMRITDVLRGSDLLDSTPRQLMLYEALGRPAPQFAHVPLLLGPDGKRLSKRHGSVAVAAKRAEGVPPERLVGWLAFLSGLLDRPEPVKAPELIRSFRIDLVPREPVLVSADMLKALEK